MQRSSLKLERRKKPNAPYINSGTASSKSLDAWAWAERISLTSDFFWIVVLATTFGLLLSLTRLRRLEGAGASKLGSLMLYVLVASIGMHMNLRAIVSEQLLFGVGVTWILIHGALMLTVMHLIKAPIFYMAVGSQANIGGAASAPVLASADFKRVCPRPMRLLGRHRLRGVPEPVEIFTVA